MESSNSNSKERELQLTQRLSKQRHSICMTWFEQLETHLHDLYLLNSPYAVDAFKPAFWLHVLLVTSIGLSKLKITQNHCSRDFLASKGVNARSSESGWQQDFEDFTRFLVTESTTLEANLNTDVKALDDGSVITESSEDNSSRYDDTSAVPRTYLNHHMLGIQFSKEKESCTLQCALSFKEENLLVRRSLLHDNIVPKPDLALELGKSISLTEAEEEAVAREVHATHARIVSGPDPEPMQEDQTGSNSGKLHVSLAGPNPEHMDDEFLATAYPKVHENLKLITDERVIEENPESHSGSMSSMKNLDDTYNFGDQFLYDKPTEDDQEKSKVIEESDSTIPDPSHQTVTSTPPVIAPFTDVSSTKPSSLVTPPPINTEATTITTSLPEITPFIALQLRVARLEQEMSEVKKTDHSADVLASIKSQVPTVVDKYLGTKLDDALLKILERHTADLIEKYSALPGPESIKNQESEKSPKEIIRIKREQGEEKQDSTYSIRSTDKVALEEFDLKSALFKHMNKNKTANRNPANYHLYHALMEALIADEDAMDKEVAVKVKDHKRKHDSDDEEDDDDDEGPSAGSNQGSSKKPRESDASASIQHPALTSIGWQITDTRDDVVNSLMHMLPNNIQITDTNSFIVSKKRSSNSSKKPKGIQTITPAEQEAADIMKALKKSKKMSKRQPGTGGSNEGTGNILGVPDESTVISRASSEGTGSKPGVHDEEKLTL
ncbi:hypothetical protein Tco_0834427 [Tanacetum coccineum]